MYRILLPALAFVASIFFGACERHSIEDTKVLFEKHGSGHAAGEGAHDGEADPEGHAPAGDHQDEAKH